MRILNAPCQHHAGSGQTTGSDRGVGNLAFGFSEQHSACRTGRVGKIGEYAISPQSEELQVLRLRVSSIVGRQASFLVPKGKNMHEKADLMRVGH